MIRNVNRSELRAIWAAFLILRQKKTLAAPIVLGCRRGAGFGFSNTRVPELDLGSTIVDCICGSHGTTKFSMIGPHGCELS
jgi:hypothetical protein